eukprot:7380052-Prymnesium_polylepis.4
MVCCVAIVLLHSAPLGARLVLEVSRHLRRAAFAAKGRYVAGCTLALEVRIAHPVPVARGLRVAGCGWWRRRRRRRLDRCGSLAREELALGLRRRAGRCQQRYGERRSHPCVRRATTVLRSSPPHK